MKRTSLIFMSLLFVLTLILSGCSGAQDHKDQSADKGKTGQNNQFPMTIKDASGKKVTIEHQPKRIIPLVPSNTEIVYALGLGDHVVGVTDNDDYPAEVKEKPKVGGYQLNIEKILSLKPDLVLAQQLLGKQQIHRLRQSGLNVFVVKNPTSFKELYGSIQMIAKMTGTGKKGDEVISGMKSKIKNVQEKLAKRPHPDKQKKVWVEISGPPEIYTTGKGTFMDEMLNKIDAKNAAESLSGFPKVSEEQAVKYNPDVIVLTYGGAKDIKKVEDRKAWNQVSAVKHHHVYTIDEGIISRPGPRMAEGVVQLAKKVYPDAFK
ncbi:iron complex transport system substrate-binding protein [Scopulibacillus darangshiensis]|uniref:Iron complex transport system substrate-binding protein n=1 Tax=Scopulibacillus darangshiensis TaxID=442528 RepID=A0A4R2PCN5_9BACL|nr:ABC transporter substrate-binding protein [Scopulibacillus darangshiensis]TCP31685.1 iron complex transport system substrate-binding protein [Scopulibacillus darangshiensis]